MQLALSPLALLAIFIVGGIVMAITTWYYFAVMKRERRTAKAVKQEHFNIQAFIDDLRLKFWELHDAKWTKLVVVMMICMCISIVGPRFIGVPFPIDAFSTLLGLIVSMFITIQWSQAIRDAERKRNENTQYGSGHILFPRPWGEVGLQLKQMEELKRIEISEAEQNELVEGAVAGAKLLPSYTALHIDEKELKEKWLKKIKSMVVTLCGVKTEMVNGEKVSKWLILLIGTHRLNEMKTPNTMSLVDETEYVDVPVMPFFGVYAEATENIYRAINTDGDLRFSGRKVGIIIDLFDLASRNELLLTGDFARLTAIDTLFAEYVYQYTQNVESARAMSDTETGYDKALSDLEERDFDNDAAGAVTAAKEITKNEQQIQSARKDSWLGKLSLGKWGKIILVGILIVVAVFIGHSVPW